jgi:hypothetical protein
MHLWIIAFSFMSLTWQDILYVHITVLVSSLHVSQKIAFMGRLKVAMSTFLVLDLSMHEQP